ncbi:NEDD8-like [Megalobrama amblycephala]|uniref:NEDD8-like n=1 Tax=Megalobrama amblycephala TaxID=75352 RepID=UPI0020142C1E|nr:NEDD8-like [Megalobrama amblycephala]
MGKTYQVIVVGIQGKKRVIDVADSEEDFNNTTVEKFKEKLAEKLPHEASDLSELRLLYINKQLNDDDKFSDHKIENNATICVILRLSGGR